MAFCILEDVRLRLGSLGQQQPSKQGPEENGNDLNFGNRKSGTVGTVFVNGSFVAL